MQSAARILHRLDRYGGERVKNTATNYTNGTKGSREAWSSSFPCPFVSFVVNVFGNITATKSTKSTKEIGSSLYEDVSWM